MKTIANTDEKLYRYNENNQDGVIAVSSRGGKVYRYNENDKENQRKESDGICYPVLEENGSWIKLLKNTNVDQQIRIENMLGSGGFGSSYPVELLYGDNGFIGYLYYGDIIDKKKIIDDDLIVPPPFGWNHPGLKYGLTPILCLLIIFIQMKWLIVGINKFSLKVGGIEAFNIAVTLSYKGITAVVLGLILAGYIVYRFLSALKGGNFALAAAGTFLGVVFVCDLIIAILSGVLMILYTILIEWIPVIIVVAIIIVLIKWKFRRR